MTVEEYWTAIKEGSDVFFLLEEIRHVEFYRFPQNYPTQYAHARDTSLIDGKLYHISDDNHEFPIVDLADCESYDIYFMTCPKCGYDENDIRICVGRWDLEWRGYCPNCVKYGPYRNSKREACDAFFKPKTRPIVGPRLKKKYVVKNGRRYYNTKENAGE